MGPAGKVQLPPFKVWRLKFADDAQKPLHNRIAGLTADLEAKTMEAEQLQTQMKTELEKAKKALEQKDQDRINEVNGLTDKFQAESKRRSDAWTAAQPNEQTPDPGLATLAVVVDAETPLDFLMGDLLSLYAYHNTRMPVAPGSKAEHEVVGLDVSRAGQRQVLPTAALPIRGQDELHQRFSSLATGLEMRRGNLPRLEEIPKGLPSFFEAFPQKTPQLILVGGGECMPPDDKSWEKIEFPVHVCIVNDGKDLPPDYVKKWRKFTGSKSGEFLLLDVNLQRQASLVLVRTRLHLWMEDRLCFGARSAP